MFGFCCLRAQCNEMLQHRIAGFVDGHTHAVWVGDRVGEFAMKVGTGNKKQLHLLKLS